MDVMYRTRLLRESSALAQAPNQTLRAFHCAVLPWCRATYALSGAALVHLESINRHFIYHEPSFLYFTRRLSGRVHASGTLLAEQPLSVAYQHFHADSLLRCFLRHVTELLQAPVIAGSFAAAELAGVPALPTDRPE